MNLPLFLLAIGLFNASPVPLLVIDMNGKKPLQSTTEFTLAEYMSRKFPIYAEDLAAVVDATEKAARHIDRGLGCEVRDTIRANHTLVIVQTDCTVRKAISVRLVTLAPEAGFSCDFEVVRKEEDSRKAQRKLLSLSTYLSQ